MDMRNRVEEMITASKGKTLRMGKRLFMEDNGDLYEVCVTVPMLSTQAKVRLVNSPDYVAPERKTKAAPAAKDAPVAKAPAKTAKAPAKTSTVATTKSRAKAPEAAVASAS